MNRDVLGDLRVPQFPEDNVEVEDEPVGIQRDADGTIDGGVAGPINGEDGTLRRRAADCDLLLYINCMDNNLDDFVPNHPILKHGVTVSIGLDKSTKLSAVFNRYTEFCNEHSSQKIEESELEFIHCQLLNRSDTAEVSALMKNDKIRVRRDRSAEREAQTDLRKLYRDSDREYFSQLRNLLPGVGGSSRTCDVIFDCQGKLIDESGRNQQVLSTTVRGSSVILSKRCKWLGTIIQAAREEHARRSIVIIPTNDVVHNDSDDDDSPLARNCLPYHGDKHIVANTTTSSHSPDDENDGSQQPLMRDDNDADAEDDDDAIGVLSYPVPKNHNHHSLGQGGAAEIENDDDDDDDRYPVANVVMSSHHIGRPRSPEMDANARHGSNAQLLLVTLENHPPDAIKLLLEYCYTNRVIPLGFEAFVQACRTKSGKPNRPVPPYHHGSTSSRRWPGSGVPQVPFSVTLAAISLAEEAGMHRLSLMCEVAASQLVSVTNVVEALSMCTTQKKRTGNFLPRLRESAISIVLRSGPRGVFQLPAFQRAMEERNASIVPTLLTGTMEAVVAHEKRKGDSQTGGVKREWSAISGTNFDDLDREDAYKRERERRRRRSEGWREDPDHSADSGMYDDAVLVYGADPVVSSWAAESARRTLKRMSHQLPHVGRSVGYETLGNRVGYGMARRRTAESRRRSSDRS